MFTFSVSSVAVCQVSLDSLWSPSLRVMVMERVVSLVVELLLGRSMM